MSITPQVTVTALNRRLERQRHPVPGWLPGQFLSGTYRIQLGPNILDQFGEATRDEPDRRRGTRSAARVPNVPVVRLRYTGPFLPQFFRHDRGELPATAYDPTLPGTSKVVSKSTTWIPDFFLVQRDTNSSGLSGLWLSYLTYANDPNLEAGAHHGITNVVLLGGVGNGQHGQLHKHGLRRRRTTPIQQGGAPVLRPVQAAASLAAPRRGRGQRHLDADVSAPLGHGRPGTLNGWSLTFQKPVTDIGLGEPVADQANGASGSSRWTRPTPQSRARPGRRSGRRR